MMHIPRHIVVLLALPLVLAACGGFTNRLTSWLSTDEEDPRLETLRQLQPLLKIERQWSVSAGGGHQDGHVRLPVLLQGDTVFACSGDGVISAFSARRGKRLWRKNYKQAVSFCPGGSGGVVALGTAQGEVIILSTQDGSELWRKQLSPREITAISARQRNHIVVRSADGKLFALAADDGRLLWSLHHPLPILALRGMSVPLLYKDYAALGLDDGRLMLIDLDAGARLRELRISLAGSGSDLEKIVDIDGRLQLQDGVIYAAAYQGRTVAYDVEANQIVWLAPHGSYAGLTVDDQSVYLADANGEWRALDRYSGADVWHNKLLGVFASSAALAYKDFLVVGDADGYLNWLSTEDGTILARQKVYGDAISAAPVLWKNFVIVLDRSGHLVAYKVLSRRRVKESSA